MELSEQLKSGQEAKKKEPAHFMKCRTKLKFFGKDFKYGVNIIKVA